MSRSSGYRARVRAYVGVTDFDWYELLSSEPGVEEVNFWQPGGRQTFGALEPGELFLFKLHAPHRAIAGGGIFAHATRLPVSLAWESFGIKNGATTLTDMRARIEHYRRAPAQPHEDYTIGCILLEQPFFLTPDRWVPEPQDWHPNIVQGKGYELRDGVGREVWRQVEDALRGRDANASWPAELRGGDAPRYGEPVPVAPRLGQGSFRVLVTDAYERRCAVTGERVLPVLEAAHIRPYAAGGAHRVDNGLLLRSDLHTLFDRGYITVTPALQLEVSRRIREDFENGRDYYALHGRDLRSPAHAEHRPGEEFVRWHNEGVYRG
jgi:putative restriction endonuclease